MNVGEDNLADLFDEFYILAADAQDITPQISQHKQTLSMDKGEAEKITEPETDLIQTEETSTAQSETDNPNLISQRSLPPLSFAGANKQHIAFIYNDKIQDSKDNVEMIMNFITKALKFSLDDVAILRLTKNNGYAITQILEELNSKKAVLWGCSDILAAEKAVLAIHQVETIGHTLLLNADAAHKYHNNQALKVQLWEAAQKIFKT